MSRIIRIDSKQEQAICKKSNEIVDSLNLLSKKLAQGDDSEILVWAIPDLLACAPRPLRYHPEFGGSRMVLPSKATHLVYSWVSQLRKCGIKSIISLMHDADLRCYSGLDLPGKDLLQYYKEQAFIVYRIPYEDPHHKSSTPAEKCKTLKRIRNEALHTYNQPVKPVLIQCSAGIDRTAPVAAYICVMTQNS